MKNKITVSFHIGEQEVKSLTPEQRSAMGQRLTETMSNYYTQHTQEFKEIKENKQ